MTAKTIYSLCSNCEKQAKREVLEKEEVINVRREPIKVKLQYTKCSECGDEVIDPGFGRDPFVAAYREYRKKRGLLQPEEMRDWRKSHGITQAELAGLLRLGTATISRYENGSLQDESHDRLLKLVMDPANLRRLVELSEHVFSDARKRKLARLLGMLQAVSADADIMRGSGGYEADEFSGHCKPSLEKLYNAILFFCKGGVLKTKLNKLLFYADFAHFKQYASSITGARYAHLPLGPVPDNYEVYLGSLGSRKAVEFGEEIYPNGYVGERIEAVREPDLTIFSTTELLVLASVKERFKDYGAGEIAEYSHKEAGYRETKKGEFISYRYAKQLNF